MTQVPESFYKELKRRFSESKEFEGYDADEDPGYFIEFLVRIVYELNRERSVAK
jgi:hypothetical protein